MLAQERRRFLGNVFECHLAAAVVLVVAWGWLVSEWWRWVEDGSGVAVEMVKVVVVVEKKAVICGQSSTQS